MTQIHQLFGELYGAIEAESYADVLKKSNKILSSYPNDEDALKCKLYSLIHLEKFEDVFLITSTNNNFLFEECYALYSTKKFDEALKRLQNNKSNDSRILALKAQIYYSLERYKEAVAVYEDFLKNNSERSNNMITNLCASCVQSGDFEKLEKVVQQNQSAMKETFEMTYNAACGNLNKGDYKKAEDFLNLARSICKTSLQSAGLSEQQIKDESSIIDAQYAYIQIKKGDFEEAIKLLAELSKSKPSDMSVRAVVENNLIAIRDGHKSDSLNRLTQLRSDKMQEKLLPSQKEAIAFNLGLVLLHLNKYEECRDLIQSLSEENHTNDLLPLLTASIAIKEKQLTKAQTQLEEFASRHPESSVRTKLCLAQMHLNQNNLPAVIKTLESIESLRSTPATICALVYLYQQTNNINGAINTLDYGVKTLSKDAPFYPLLLKKNAEFKMQCHRYQEAAATYKQLLDLNKTDLEIIAALAIAYSYFDPDTAKQYESKLPDLPSDVDIDAAQLESISVPSTFARKERQPKLKESQGAKQDKDKKDEKKKKKKKRKNKPPKKIDPNVPVDPERWLPKHQRSTFKGRRGKGYKNKGAQGAISASVAVKEQGGQQAPNKEEKSQIQQIAPQSPGRGTVQGQRGGRVARGKRGGRRK